MTSGNRPETAADLNIGSLVPTEQVNPATFGIDLLPTLEVLHLLNEQDTQVPVAVGRAIDAIATVTDEVIRAFEGGHRLFYVGAGTSGRLGVLDASECPPTFSVPSDLVQGIMAGGPSALTRAVENAEDDGPAGCQAIKDFGVQSGDVVVGLSASGGAAFVIEAMNAARQAGCFTGAITCHPTGLLAQVVDCAIVVDVGPEALTGSTRLKAGTAQKLVLNMITTAAMIGWGKTYRNLMVDVNPTNAKLRDRAIRLVSALGRCEAGPAARFLEAADGQVKPAVVMALTGLSAAEACQKLASHGGRLRATLDEADCQASSQ
ncbi:MAG: N-acetylmuramic acid 6-phosphate etherase [Cyanobacteria bacterium HKST-UBA04]|nr:N-acetylmuramic acid 6-phosphate etherase [Cyanobacteria bacterium HKST-UBA04]